MLHNFLIVLKSFPIPEIETYQEKKDGTKKPWFVTEAQNTWAEVGGRATFEAQATGAPVPSFKWYVAVQC